MMLKMQWKHSQDTKWFLHILLWISLYICKINSKTYIHTTAFHKMHIHNTNGNSESWYTNVHISISQQCIVLKTVYVKTARTTVNFKFRVHGPLANAHNNPIMGIYIAMIYFYPHPCSKCEKIRIQKYRFWVICNSMFYEQTLI